MKSYILGRNPKSGFRGVPGPGFRVPGFRVEPMTIYNIWVPVGSGFQANWVKMGSGGFRVPTNFFLCRLLSSTLYF